MNFNQDSGSQREGLHFNRQKFQKDERELQLLLSEHTAVDATELHPEIQVTGLNFSARQLRAAAALYFLLDCTNFRGNAAPGRERDYEASHFRGSLPNLRFTCPEYLKAYGIKRKGDGGYDCGEAKDALQALKSFTLPFRIVYKKLVSHRDGEPQYRVVVVTQALIGVLEDYGILSENENNRLHKADMPSKVRNITITFSPIWVDGITSYYLRRPVNLYQAIRDFHKGRRFTEAVYLFADYLLTFDFSPVRIYLSKLERRLWLDRHRKQEQPGRVRKAIEDALRTSESIGLLNNYHFDGLGAVTLELNPDKCTLVRKKLSSPGPIDELQSGQFD